MERARNEISGKNKYWISKHRYLELKHFCLQYPEWKRAYNCIENIPSSKSIVYSAKCYSDDYFLELAALKRSELSRNIEMIERTAQNADEYLGPFILKAVTQGVSYTQLHVKEFMACSKDMYYDRYHKFFWLLNQAR